MNIRISSKLRQYLYLGFLVLIAAGVMVFAHNFLRSYSIRQIVVDLNNIPTDKKIMAVLMTAASYMFLTVYDFLGLTYLGRKLGKLNVIFTSFISYAFSNSIGLSVLASGSLRYRYYTLWGLSFSEISKMVAFTTVTLWIGLLTSAGVAFSVEPLSQLSNHFFTYLNTRYIGIIFIAVVLGYLFLISYFRKPYRFFGQDYNLPSPTIGILQVLVGCADWILAGSVLYILLPQQVQMPFMTFIGVYLLAQTAGLISHVPGGILVFESVVLSFFPKSETASMIGALLVYRVTYYIIPLLAAAIMIGFSESYRIRNRLMEYLGYVNRAYSAATPRLLSIIVLIVGFYMLMTGATPINPYRFPFVREVLPLFLVESSHFLESLVGLGLIILSRGLSKRIDLSYQLTIVLLVAGTVLAILKGAEIETAVFSIAVIAAMQPSRKLFDRKSSFFAEVMTKEWIFTVFMLMAVFTWLGFFSYKHVEYRSSLWWTFTFNDQAPRFLRALVGTFTMLFALLFYKMMLPSNKVINSESDSEDVIKSIVTASGDTDAFLAYLSDKEFLISNSEKSFIMYGVEGRNFISMGDPIGSDSDDNIAELVRDFRKLSEHHGCKAVFYEVGTKYIPQYMDAGFKIFKIGEEARVPLENFSLTGGRWSGARNTLKKMEKEGCSVEIVPIERIPEIIDKLKQVSDEWLETKNTREKKFSLGCFDENYVIKTPAAVVYRDGKPVAFSNLWMSADKDEISVDMMRYDNSAPKGVMEYLFISLMLYARDNGYKYFNLGIAPLSGIETHSFAPFWNRIASTVYNHGEHFYNFKGLRSYKEKFDPEWKPKYIAVQSLFALPGALTSVASLISGGTSGIFVK